MMLMVVLTYLLLVNVVAIALYHIDKGRAQKGAWRIPERVLLGIAVLGGSIGALFAMYAFRHKTLHPQFKYGVPAILLLQLGLVYYFSDNIAQWLI